MISSAVAKARGSVFATLPSESNTTVAGITLGTRSAAATRRLPSCSVGSRTPSSASRSKPGRLVLVLVHRHHHHVGSDPSLVLRHRRELGRARRAPVRPQVEHDAVAGQRRPDVDDRAVGGAFGRHIAQRRRTGLPTRMRTRGQLGALARSGQRRRTVGVAVLASGSGRRRLGRVRRVPQFHQQCDEQRGHDHQDRDGPASGSRGERDQGNPDAAPPLQPGHRQEVFGFRSLHQRGGDLRLGRPRTERRAIPGQHAHPAGRFAGVAHPATVKDHPVTEQRPLLAFDEFADRRARP